MHTHIPVSRFAERLEGLSPRRAWVFVSIGTLVIHVADLSAPGAFAPLFLVVVCAACWRLGRRTGYCVALAGAALTVMPFAIVGDWRNPLLVAIAVSVQLVTFCCVAATIGGCRTLYDRAVFMAHRDRMTGALNHESFQEQTIQAIKSARKTNQTVLLAMLDLDEFKSLNDHHGHAAADAALRAFALGVKTVLRQGDLFGRLGGDEFAFLAVVPFAVTADDLAGTLHKQLSALLASSPYPLTCSMGALIIPPLEPRSDVPAVFHMVDLLMYAAKQAGKNTVRVGTAKGEMISAAAASHSPAPI